MKKTRKQLETRVLELEASLASTYHFASKNIAKLSNDYLMGSGIVISITHLGGKPATLPFMIADGFSSETLIALQGDILRSFETATELKPN